MKPPPPPPPLPPAPATQPARVYPMVLFDNPDSMANADMLDLRPKAPEVSVPKGMALRKRSSDAVPSLEDFTESGVLTKEQLEALETEPELNQSETLKLVTNN